VPSRAKPPLSFAEQIGLLALLISLVALSIDAILPALPALGQDLGTQNANAPQYVISALLSGLCVGQLLYGPISDSMGRRSPIILGLFIFLIGSLLCSVAQTFEHMLAGRVLQGIGAAGPRVVAIALVRDSYQGAQMARIMSFVMAVFILVPALAPALGQLILMFGDWRDIFVMFIVLSSTAIVWFVFRQPETLVSENRRAFSLRGVLQAMVQCLLHPVSRGYALAAGVVFGSFVGFLTSIQQIFEVTFGVREAFAAYFAILALGIGAASITNSQLVVGLGMQRLSRLGLGGLTLLSGIGVLLHFALPVDSFTLWTFMLLMFPICFCFGILFGNFNALAMEPMGHIAGSAAAVIASLTSLIAVIFGTAVGQSFNGTFGPVFIGFGVAALAGFLLLISAERGRMSLASKAP